VTKQIKGNLPYINPELYREPDMNDADHDRLELVREAVGNAFNDMIDKAAERFPLADHKQYVVQDVALLVMFLSAIKMGEITGNSERRQILSAFNHLLKRAQGEIPERILMFCREFLREPQPGATTKEGTIQ
jgi:hypothetical protein